jgi:long-chain fatty acid transport protein
MNRIAAASAALLASTALAQAGGLDRNQLGTGVLFEEGTYAELGYSFVNPTVSGVLSYSPTLGQISGLFKLLPAPADRLRLC